MAQQPVGFVPDGFVPDPAPADTVPRDARGRPAVSSDTSDAPASPLLEMLGPLAHPQTLVDFARLLTLPVDSVKRAVAGALSMSAARNAVPSGAAVRDTTGRVLQFAGDFDLTKPLKSTAGKVGDALVRSAEEARQASRPGYPREFSTPAPAPVEVPPPVAPAAASTPTAVDEFTAARTARANALPDQKALNEAALAARREAYVASQQGVPAGPVVAASGQMKLTAPEFKEFQRLLQQKGMTPSAALEEVKTMRALAERFGLSAPTAADARFPKGARR